LDNEKEEEKDDSSDCSDKGPLPPALPHFSIFSRGFSRLDLVNKVFDLHENTFIHSTYLGSPAAAGTTNKLVLVDSSKD